jgi:hypothetical protein
VLQLLLLLLLLLLISILPSIHMQQPACQQTDNSPTPVLPLPCQCHAINQINTQLDTHTTPGLRLAKRKGQTGKGGLLLLLLRLLLLLNGYCS